MFVFLISRLEQIHIVNLCSNTRYSTVCGKVLFKSDHLITLATDNIFNGICVKCKSRCNDMVIYSLNTVRERPYKLQDFLILTKMGFISQDERYYRRKLFKIYKLQNLSNRNKIYG